MKPPPLAPPPPNPHPLAPFHEKATVSQVSRGSAERPPIG
jgi:hypothetical protein